MSHQSLGSGSAPSGSSSLGVGSSMRPPPGGSKPPQAPQSMSQSSQQSSSVIAGDAEHVSKQREEKDVASASIESSGTEPWRAANTTGARSTPCYITIDSSGNTYVARSFHDQRSETELIRLRYDQQVRERKRM